MRKIEASFVRTPLKRNARASLTWQPLTQSFLSLTNDAPVSHVPLSTLMLSSASSAGDAPSDASISVVPTQQTFDAVMPPTETLLGMGLIVVLCALVGWVWANQVVPTSRTNLALSKSRGEVKEYLDELRASDPSNSNEMAPSLPMNSTVTSMGEPVNITEPLERQDVLANDRAFERWLFTDWLQDNKSARSAGRKKEPALPILKNAKWNSGDNPILVATLLISLGVLFTAFTERAVSLL